jgi:predicted P-loop ATPase
LKDASGNRRFWPVRCGAIDRDALAADREQIWAEAVALYRAGNRWWPDAKDGNLLKQIEQEQADRIDSDPWQVPIDQFVIGRDRVTVDEVLGHLGKVIDARTLEERGEAMVRRTQMDANRASRCLRLAGFERTRWRDGERRIMGFERKR